MSTKPGTDQEPKPSRRRPATTPEGRENQMISRAVELAEQRMMAGTASAQEIVHYLKLGSSREKLEQERLRQENELLKAKAQAISNQGDLKQITQDALEAMKMYSGYGSGRDDDEFAD